MADAIAVLNTASSSIKFSLSITRAAGLELELHGQVEGVYSMPHFIAKTREGATAARKPSAACTSIGVVDSDQRRADDRPAHPPAVSLDKPV